MAIKKSELYSKLWASCDELRGGMDASQYKDYVLVLLFIKYISDKYDGQPYAPITIPKGASFKDMVALKGKTNIGELINTKIVGPLARENKLSDMPDFDSEKLGSTGKEKSEKLTNLIAIFEDPALNFSKNRAEGDDILGDAYEYLMRHFATESGKSKGQFYTPAEVSRVMAQILGIKQAKITASTTVYDPTCGSGSLLLKVGDEAGSKVTLYGQEKDTATSGLARMNMILHNNPTALISQGNTLSDPKFMDGNKLKQFDYVVANPPFSDKRWSTGLDPLNDPHERFAGFGVPPAKQGDYAYLLHILRSLKSTGKGACILPHGVLLRGNAEAEIRKNLIQKKYIKGIIGLPPNLFYGTPISACIIVIDKEHAPSRKGIFMIDGSEGYTKDGPKNRLRAQDVHKLVDVFINQTELPKFSRHVPFEEIEKNEFNLNMARYIESQRAEESQDINAHLDGGIAESEIDSMEAYWSFCPDLKNALFSPIRPGYLALAVEKSEISKVIFEHHEFKKFVSAMADHFVQWKTSATDFLSQMTVGHQPKELISKLSENLLRHYKSKPMLNAYDIYQHLMDYWAKEMQDDCYAVASDGWKAEVMQITEKDKKGKEKDKGWICDLLPKEIVIRRYFHNEKKSLEELKGQQEEVLAERTEIEEDHSGDEGAFGEFDKVNKQVVASRLDDIMADDSLKDDVQILSRWLYLYERESELKRKIKNSIAELDVKAKAIYPKLSESEIKDLIIQDKWMAAIDVAVRNEMDQISLSLAAQINELVLRYESPLSDLSATLHQAELTVSAHLHMIQDLLSGRRRIDRSEKVSKYKQSEVGLIPEDWEVKLLPEVCKFRSGKAHEQYVVETGPFVCVNSKFISTDGQVRKYTSQNFCPAKTNDILMVMSDLPNGRALAKVFVADRDNYYAVNQRVCALTPYRDDPFFLALQLNRNPYFLKFDDGVSQTHLLNPIFEKCPIVLPSSLEEQKAISRVIVDLNLQLVALERKLDKITLIKQGMMQELLSGRTRLI